MPEGDTIHGAAGRIRGVLVGKEIASIETPHPRFERDRWPERLRGRAVRAVDSKGKHLFIRFEGDLTLHSHLRMTGQWGVYRHGERWRRSPRRAWLVIRTAEHEVVEFDGPVLELMTDSRTRLDRRIAGLGPDILAPELDTARVLRRLREDDPTRPIGDALLDQRTIAGIGNLWKIEGCFAAGIDPWRPAGEVSDEEVLAILGETRPRMQASAVDGLQDRFKAIYGKAGRPCPRCAAAGVHSPVKVRGQGDGNRPTYWCPQCQR
jgi:endonuclease VIII